MFVIREEQMKVFEAYMVRTFENAMVKHLQKAFPRETKEMKDQKLRSLIQSGIGKASGYDIRSESDVQTFIEYMVKFSPNFDTAKETSWMNEILRLKEIDGARKMRRIANRLRRMEEETL